MLRATKEKTNEAEAQAGEALAAGTQRTGTGPAKFLVAGSVVYTRHLAALVQGGFTR